MTKVGLSIVAGGGRSRTRDEGSDEDGSTDDSRDDDRSHPSKGGVDEDQESS